MTESPVLVVTGASSGIGEATARYFAQRGYRVVAAARRLDRLETLSGELISQGAEVLPVETDVSKIESVEMLIELVNKRWGRIDILFNNAGFGKIGWLENLDPIEDIQSQVAVNLVGLIQVTRAVLPYMIARRSGHIINMSSIAGLIASPTYSIYAATKFGVSGFSQALRREVGIYGIKVSVIYPGGVRSEFTTHAGIKRKTGITTPARLKLTSEDVAKAVMQLVKKPRREMIIPRVMILTVWFSRIFPGLTDRLIEKKFTIPERLD